jgi:hypothetical protein
MGTWQNKIFRNRPRPARFARRPQLESSKWQTRFTPLLGIKRARHWYFLFPVPNCHTEFLTFLRFSPPFFSRVLPVSRLLLRARQQTSRWASGFGK